jgi:hypothetical protein
LSRTSGGTTTAMSAVRSTARGTPITAAESIEATRMPSAVIPALAPNTATGAAVIRNHTPSTTQLKPGVVSASGPSNRPPSSPPSSQSIVRAANRRPNPATALTPSAGRPNRSPG